jgi:hypothetical protein
LKWIGRFAHYPRTAGHTFDAASNIKIAVIGLDSMGGLIDRFQARAAQAIDCGAGNGVGQTGEE